MNRPRADFVFETPEATVGVLQLGVGAIQYFDSREKGFSVGREPFTNPAQSAARNSFSYKGLLFGRTGEDKNLLVPDDSGAHGVIPMQNHWHPRSLHGDVPDKRGNIVRQGTNQIELEAGHAVEPNNYPRRHRFTTTIILRGAKLIEVMTYIHLDQAPGWIAPFFHPFYNPGTSEQPVLLSASATHFARPVDIKDPTPFEAPLKIAPDSDIDFRTPRSVPKGLDETHSGWDGYMQLRWPNNVKLTGIASFTINDGPPQPVPHLHKFTGMGPVCAEPTLGRANGNWLEINGKIPRGEGGIVVRQADKLTMTFSQTISTSA